MNHASRIAVLAFPGTNCMRETRDTLLECGAESEILWWNESPARLRSFDACVLAGGFAYEDRVRAGAIAAKEAIVDVLAQEAARGKPILGICNGAQILVESGLVPGIEPGRVEVALSHNRDPEWSGYLCEWVYLRPASRRGLMQYIEPAIIPMPVGHGEGCFTAHDDFIESLEARGQVAFQYVDPTGEVAMAFPHNPNASRSAAAGVCDPSGRIVALMPHPERAAWLFQVPPGLQGDWARRRQQADHWQALRERGPGRAVYEALVRVAEQARDEVT